MIDNLLQKYHQEKNISDTYKLEFKGVDGFDVYNITAPFLDEGKEIIAGRVEYRDSEDSKVCFFEKVTASEWTLIEDYPQFSLQDPYITFINDELVFGGTQVHFINGDLASYNALKYRGKSVKELKEFFTGPKMMKDIRLVQLQDEKILCFTRPNGKIGFYIMDSLDELTIENINNAPLLNIFSEGIWGGVNETFALNEKEVGALAHIARFDDEGNRHYYPFSFIFNFVDNIVSDMKIILCRDDLKPGPAKRNDLHDVIFSGGLIKNSDDSVNLYMGVSDVEAHVAVIANPFKKKGE